MKKIDNIKMKKIRGGVLWALLIVGLVLIGIGTAVGVASDFI